MKMLKLIPLVIVLLMCHNLIAKTKTVYVDHFSILEIIGYFDVTLVQADMNEITIDAPEELILFVQIEESSNHLSINFNENPGPYRHIHIKIAFKQLKEIESKIHGSLRSNGTLNLDNLFLDIVSFQPTHLELNVHKIDIHATGHGDILLKGHATKGNINTAMNGQLDASTFVVDYLNIDASGSGNISINAKIEASANHTGQGKLKFTGDIQKVDFCPLEFG